MGNINGKVSGETRLGTRAVWRVTFCSHNIHLGPLRRYAIFGVKLVKQVNTAGNGPDHF